VYNSFFSPQRFCFDLASQLLNYRACSLCQRQCLCLVEDFFDTSVALIRRRPCSGTGGNLPSGMNTHQLLSKSFCCYPPQPAVTSAALAAPPSPSQPEPPAPSQPKTVTVAQSPAAEAGAAAASPSAAAAVAAPPIDLGRVNFDLTPVAARARILRPRNEPEQQQRLPVSAGDPQAYWISKKRRIRPKSP
jgi:hypothetical protein